MRRAAILLTMLACAGAHAAATPPAGPQCSGEGGEPRRIALPVGKSTLVRLPEAVANRSTGNPAVVQALLLSPQMLYVLGLETGTTNMIIQGKSGRCTALDFIVGMDPVGLQAVLAELMPDETAIRVTAAADTLVLSGTVADITAVGRAVELASAFVRKPLGAAGAGGKDAAPPASSNRVINLLSVAAPQQVMLEVKIAEVSKSLLERLDVAAAVRTASGSWTATLLSNLLGSTDNPLLEFRKSNGTRIGIDAQKQDGLVKILAEPTVMALSGQEGSFLAGGKILIPVGQENTGGATRITLEEKEFGVGLKFTPTVLSGGRINLQVAPEVSELSREGVGITAAGVSGRAILPLITTRRAHTTVQLFDGQSFAIGGLIRNNSAANITGVPLLGEIPVLGALFRSTDFQADKSELVFIVTPRIVKPLPAGARLPTDAASAPSRAELFLGGVLEKRNVPAKPASGYDLP
ncbi:MAG TPA: type II and III secretion system protein family protein [Burkholderiaceae bacterium]